VVVEPSDFQPRALCGQSDCRGHPAGACKDPTALSAMGAEQLMAPREAKVVGYFAYLSPMQVVCADVDACVLSGSSEAMNLYLAGIYPTGVAKATVKKTRFGEIHEGLRLGAAYAFDKESYARFYPLALEAGIPVAAADFDDKRHQGTRFFTVRLVAPGMHGGGPTAR